MSDSLTPHGRTPRQESIVEACDAIKSMLLEKNRKYGDSALNPVRIFSTAGPAEQIKVRIDDKISRLRAMRAVEDDEDVLTDLIGYLVLLKVSMKS